MNFAKAYPCRVQVSPYATAKWLLNRGINAVFPSSPELRERAQRITLTGLVACGG
jgi:hypothetical protein